MPTLTLLTSQRRGPCSNVSAMPVCACRWREALGLRDRMVAEGIKPDGYSFNALIEACSKGGQVNHRCSLAVEVRVHAELCIFVSQAQRSRLGIYIPHLPRRAFLMIIFYCYVVGCFSLP